MKKTLTLFLISLVFITCSKTKEKTFELTEFKIEDISIRAIETLDEKTMGVSHGILIAFISILLSPNSDLLL